MGPAIADLPSLVVVGCQWGDEGKGKIADYFSRDANYVVRFNGGCNAGHTIKVGNETYRLKLLPSGIFYGKKLLITNGVVIDPSILLSEISNLRSQGFTPNLKVSDRAHVTFAYHKLQDAAEEDFKGELKAGTTLRGIGPTYADKVSKFGIRTSDLLEADVLEARLKQISTLKRRLLELVYKKQAGDLEDLVEKGKHYGEALRGYIADTSLLLNDALDKDEQVLFEGAQGFLLDIDFGVYPFGTSSNAVSGAVCTGAGIPPNKIDNVVGVAKSYTSRVGEGPVPTELRDETGVRLREKGKEFGTVTGRPRRCGWLDAVALRASARINGLTGLALTKLDTLGGFQTVKICTEYEFDGDLFYEQPASSKLYSKCTPRYEELPGWPDLTEQEWLSVSKRGFEALPKNCRRYIERVEELTKTQVIVVSVGQGREATIERQSCWPQ